MKTVIQKTQRLLELLGHDEIPFGFHHANRKPDGFGPKPGQILTREREAAGDIDWEEVFSNFSCLLANLWLARKKGTAAWVSHRECGCSGAGFYAGLLSPYLEMDTLVISTGISGVSEGEHFLPSVESARTFMEASTPPETSEKYGILKPLDQFITGESPEVVVFFLRPETLTGLNGLVWYTTGDVNSVTAPFGSGCSNIIAWPLIYQKKGEERAVLGGFDVSVRKYLKTDELTLAVPFSLYQRMLDAMESSPLTRHIWQGVRKKALKSARVWGES